MKHVCVCAENGRPTEDLLEPRAAELGARGAAGGQARRRRGRRARGAAPRAAGDTHTHKLYTRATPARITHPQTQAHTQLWCLSFFDCLGIHEVQKLAISIFSKLYILL